MFPTVETPRLILRCVAPTDAADVSRLITPAVAQWVASWSVPFTLEMAVERIASARARAEAKTGMPFAVTAKADGIYMGWIGIVTVSPGRAVFGYWLGEEFHGRGFMREAARPVVQAAFDFLGVDVIEAQAQLANAPSIAVMKSCGMQYVGEKRIFAPSRQVEDLCACYEIARPV